MFEYNSVIKLNGTKSKDPIAELKEIDVQKRQLSIREGELLEKGMKSNNPETVIAANKMWEDIQQRHPSGVKSLLFDPNDWATGTGYKHKRFSLSFGTLRKMSKTPVIRAIIGTRQTQVSAFATPQASKYDTGFVIRKKKEHYSEEAPKVNAKDKKMILWLTDFILNCGTESNKWHGDNFKTFLNKVVEDSLSLDQACFEVVRSRGGKKMPSEFLAVDAATIRLAETYDEDEVNMNIKKKAIKGYLPSYVQVIDGEIRTEYYPWELCFGTRNTKSSIESNMYGNSELEDLINIITWMLFGDAYNGKFFSQGSSPKGMLVTKGNVNRNRIAEFRQQWLAMIAGVNNAWKIPVLQADMEWIDLQKNNTDMQFGKWQEYLIKVACAMYKISPEECGFELGNASGGSPLGGQVNNEYKLKYSRDKGLKPLLSSIEFWINKWIIGQIDPSFEFAFVGMDADTVKEELEQNIQKVSNFMGVQEIRDLYNLGELPEGDTILNQVWLQNKQQAAFADQQEGNTDAAEGSFDEDINWEDLEANLEDAAKGMEPEFLNGKFDNPMLADAFAVLTS